MNIYHPSIERYKKYRPIAMPALACIGPEEGCFYSGLFIWSRAVDTNTRLYNAQNSAVASKDIRIYNVYQDDTKHYNVNNFTSLSDISLPPISQGPNGCCSLIPYMHQIQNSLNFPIDIASLIACLETSPPPNAPQNFHNIADSPPANDGHSGTREFIGKLSNLLFSGKCIPIYEAPPNIDKCGSDGLPLGNTDLQKNKDCECPSPKTGIKITAKKITIPEKPRDLYENFQKNGPIPIVLRKQDFGKLWLHHNGHNNWNDLRDLFAADIYDRIKSLGGDANKIMFDSSHAVTLTNVTQNSDGTYTIELTNSWGEKRNKIYIDYKDSDDLILSSTNRSGVTNYVIEVTQCTPSTGSSCDDEDNDHEAACKALGYDGIDKTRERCPCLCGQGRYYSVSKHKCVCATGPDTYPCSGLSTLAVNSLEINSKIYNVVPVSEIRVI